MNGKVDHPPARGWVWIREVPGEARLGGRSSAAGAGNLEALTGVLRVVAVVSGVRPPPWPGRRRERREDGPVDRHHGLGQEGELPDGQQAQGGDHEGHEEVSFGVELESEIFTRRWLERSRQGRHRRSGVCWAMYWKSESGLKSSVSASRHVWAITQSTAPRTVTPFRRRERNSCAART